jgi:hypothetical protein
MRGQVCESQSFIHDMKLMSGQVCESQSFIHDMMGMVYGMRCSEFYFIKFEKKWILMKYVVDVWLVRKMGIDFRRRSREF